MDLSIQLASTAFAMSGGEALVSGAGEVWSVDYTGSGLDVGDTFSFTLTDGETAFQTLIGADRLNGISPTFAFTWANKEYLLEGANVHFSVIADPTKWKDIYGIGNGQVKMANQFATPEDLVAMATFQGKLVFFSRTTTQIWQVNADPEQWVLERILPNTGTLAKRSVQSKGDLDVLFLSDTGIRSLRALETSLAAFVDDVGSPIDSLIQAKVLGNPTPAYVANAAAIIEPSSGRYWLFLQDTIYVLSFFPSSKVLAWSTYVPKDNGALDGGTPQTFTVTKFFLYKGRVYAWNGGNRIYVYGGADGNTYDGSVAIAETSWLDMRAPGNLKSAGGINAAFIGGWKVTAGMDPVSGDLDSSNPLWSATEHTYDQGLVPMVGQGSHFKVRMETTGAVAATFSSLVFHYQENEEV